MLFYLRKFFLSYFEVVIECSEHFKMVFFIFANFWVTKLKLFFEKVRQSVQYCLIPKLVIENILRNSFQDTWKSKRIFWTFENKSFHFFANFWVAKSKMFTGKATQSVQNLLNLKLDYSRIILESKIFYIRFLC